MSRRKPKSPARLEADRHLKESLYYSNPMIYKLIREDRREAKERTGTCIDCPRPRIAGNIRCRSCRAVNRRSVMVAWRRRRDEERRLDAAYRPLDSIVDLTRIRVLRAARFLDWFSGSELNELLGNVDDTARNTATQMLTRLARAGRFERREAVGDTGMRAAGSPYEYRITQAGRDELERTIGVGRTVRNLPRRAA